MTNPNTKEEEPGMEFVSVPPIFEGQPMWAAQSGGLGFIITQDEEDGYSVSCKPIGSQPFDGQRHDLGGYCAYKTLASAVAACEKLVRQRHIARYAQEQKQTQ